MYMNLLLGNTVVFIGLVVKIYITSVKPVEGNTTVDSTHMI